ncbi:hypothetical protein [Aquabacterium sp.]|uniref:hypothetical protein n=1 Tax=Aquabacterium sp. TaxID=1872578 RepID=UPI002BE03636|nr:hypothetical protein [Aquabacterium sp.]HSW07477.1 hypothetical protein [Aquabacterium sp.]
MFEHLPAQRLASTPRVDVQRRQVLAAALSVACLPTAARAAPPAQPSQSAKPEGPMISFRGTEFLHRWSKGGQHEFTPQRDADLTRWRDMITLNLHESATQGEQLAGIANQVLANYQQHGKILQTRSTPRTAQRPAEHLIVAVLGTPQLLEAAFARCLLHEGVGLVAVVSHRVYGQAVGPEMSAWLGANGPQVEQALMAWAALPGVASLKRLRGGA